MRERGMREERGGSEGEKEGRKGVEEERKDGRKGERGGGGSLAPFKEYARNCIKERRSSNGKKQ